MKANLYMIMGVMLEVITFLWSINTIVPKAVFIVVALIGIIPVIKLGFRKEAEPTEKENFYWGHAISSTIAELWGLLVIIWIFACISELVELPISVDLSYVVPFLVGVGFLFTGYKFKIHIRLSENDDEEE